MGKKNIIVRIIIIVNVLIVKTGDFAAVAGNNNEYGSFSS